MELALDYKPDRWILFEDNLFIPPGPEKQKVEYYCKKCGCTDVRARLVKIPKQPEQKI